MGYMMKTLLKRYNTGMDLSQEEKARLSARRVGLKCVSKASLPADRADAALLFLRSMPKLYDSESEGSA